MSPGSKAAESKPSMSLSIPPAPEPPPAYPEEFSHAKDRPRRPASPRTQHPRADRPSALPVHQPEHPRADDDHQHRHRPREAGDGLQRAADPAHGDRVARS